MNAQQLAKECEFEIIHMAEESPEVTGAYVCDLLSWVIGRAEAGAALVTVMTNVNVIAVAVMAELSCVILTEGVTIDKAALQKAKMQEISVLRSNLPSYETCLKIGKVL